MQDRIYPTKWEPTTVAIPGPDFTKMRYPRVYQKRGPLIYAFSKEGLELAKEKEKKEAEDNRQFGVAMELVWAQIEEQKKEVCILSLSQLSLGEEVKAKEDDHVDADHDHEEEEDPNDLQEELLETVSALPTDRETKQTDQLVRKALQSVDIIQCISKLTPAS